MKKLLLSSAAMLLGLLAYSQEADGSGKYVELQVIPRFEFNPYASTSGGDGSSGYDFGNSSIYTLFEGSLSDHLSFTLCNHWFSMEPAELYQSTFYSNTSNWVDYANIDLNFGGWDFVLGKDMICTGGFEYEEWDLDVDGILASQLWNTLPCYQWGAKVMYTIPSEMSSFALQAVTSPFGEHPFASSLFAYSAQWRGDFGPFHTIWSITTAEREKARYDYFAALGQQLELGNWTIGLDWYNTLGCGDFHMLGGNSLACNTFRGTLKFAPSDRFDASLVGNYYMRMSKLDPINTFNGGLALHYYPLKDNQAIRIHAAGGFDNAWWITDSFAEPESLLVFSVGVTVNLTLLSL